jgi:hypothetical protein
MDDVPVCARARARARACLRACVRLCDLVTRRFAWVLGLMRVSPEHGPTAGCFLTRAACARRARRENWISLKEAKAASYADGEAGDFEKMADYLKSKAPNAVIFDTTAAEPV